MATVKENLIAAKALIDTPEKWGKEAYSPKPGCFCALGAIAAVHESDPEQYIFVEDRALCAALGVARTAQVAEFNDDPATTHADIMALFQRAIDAQDGQS